MILSISPLGLLPSIAFPFPHHEGPINVAKSYIIKISHGRGDRQTDGQGGPRDAATDGQPAEPEPIRRAAPTVGIEGVIEKEAVFLQERPRTGGWASHRLTVGRSRVGRGRGYRRGGCGCSGGRGPKRHGDLTNPDFVSATGNKVVCRGGVRCLASLPAYPPARLCGRLPVVQLIGLAGRGGGNQPPSLCRPASRWPRLHPNEAALNL